MAPALTSSAPTAPHELSKGLANNKVDKSIFPDGIRTSGQHEPLFDQLRPYEDFPQEITGPTAWSKADYQSNPERWTHVFSESEVAEISSAADKFIAAGEPLTGITKEKFQLPEFSKFLGAPFMDCSARMVPASRRCCASCRASSIPRRDTWRSTANVSPGTGR